MRIIGVVSACNDGHAYKILEELVLEGLLDWFELDGREDIPSDEINSRYDAVVDCEGYLTMDEDFVGELSDLVHNSRGVHTFSFEAER